MLTMKQYLDRALKVSEVINEEWTAGLDSWDDIVSQEVSKSSDAKKLELIVRKMIKDDGIGGARDVLHAAADALEWKQKLQAAKMIRKFIETKFDTL